MRFDDDSSARGNIKLIPAGTLALGRVTVRAIKQAKSGTRYADLALKIEGGEHSGWVVFTNVNDPTERADLPQQYTEHSEKGREMGFNAVVRMIEAAGIVRPGDKTSYDRLDNINFEQVMSLIHGKLVAFKIGIETGEGSFPDKNNVKTWLSPNPKSDSFKLWTALKEGKTRESDHDSSLAAAAAGWRPPPETVAALGPPAAARPAGNPLQGAGWVAPPPAQPAPQQGQLAVGAPATPARPPF